MLPFLDLRQYERADLLRDLGAALAVTFLVVPQGVAYALIAGLPPHMGLYAAGLPVIIGSLMRSSRHAITGPTNAVSVVVGSSFVATVGQSDLPTAVATLAVLVGGLQIAASLLRLGSLVDFISAPVLVGFTTGAGVLIGVGQLPNITRTTSSGHTLVEKVMAWSETLGEAHLASVVMALGTAALVLGFRRLDSRLPGASLAIFIMTGVSLLLGEQELRTVADLAPVPSGLPLLTLPDLGLVGELLPMAGACTVISLVESSAIASAIATRTGQRLSLTTEFLGEGLANLTSGLFGGLPTAGSLSRSVLNERSGARTRLAGALSGVFVLAVMASLAFVVDLVPVASLAGLLLVVCAHLVEPKPIIRILRSHNSDRVAFVATLFGTFFLHLDEAIYLGVGISLVLFLQRERLLAVRAVGIDDALRIREAALANVQRIRECAVVRILNLEGSLFFGSASELQRALEDQLREPKLRVLVVRLKRTQHIDITAARSLAAVAERLRAEGRRLVLVGMRDKTIRYLRRVRVAGVLEEENLFPSEETAFDALENAIAHSLAHAAEHTCEDEGCPLAEWLEKRGRSV